MQKIHSIILACLLISITSYSQFDKVETKTLWGGKMVTMNLKNLLILEQMTFSDFRSTMNIYNYQYLEREKAYLWNGGDLMTPYFSISKDETSTGFLWTKDSEMIDNLKDQLRPYFSGYSNGNTVYLLSDKGNKYRLTLGSSFLLILQV